MPVYPDNSTDPCQDYQKVYPSSLVSRCWKNSLIHLRIGLSRYGFRLWYWVGGQAWISLSLGGGVRKYSRYTDGHWVASAGSIVGLIEKVLKKKNV